jgi:Lon protease-like protein
MEIPLFPLPNLVLFPDVILPLHIFEDRYKIMINHSIDKDEAFGLVCLKGGTGEENEDSIHRVGVTARIVQVERLEDERLNILCRGEARFRVRRFTQQIPYWKASVEFFDDEYEAESSLQALFEEVAALYRKAFELGGKLSAEEPVVESELAVPESAAGLSYMISYVLDLEAEEKQKLLEMTLTSERLQLLVGALQAAVQQLEQQISLKGVVQKVRGNGDLGRPGKKH